MVALYTNISFTYCVCLNILRSFLFAHHLQMAVSLVMWLEIDASKMVIFFRRYKYYASTKG